MYRTSQHYAQSNPLFGEDDFYWNADCLCEITGRCHREQMMLNVLSISIMGDMAHITVTGAMMT